MLPFFDTQEQKKELPKEIWFFKNKSEIKTKEEVCFSFLKVTWLYVEEKANQIKK